MLSIIIKNLETQEKVDQVYAALLLAWGKADHVLETYDGDGNSSLNLVYGTDNDWDCQPQDVADLVNISVDHIDTEYNQED